MSTDVESSLPRMRQRLYALSALAAAAALALAGCGDDDSPSAEPAGGQSSAPMDETPSMDDDMEESPKDGMDDSESADAAPGVYRDYTEAAVSEDGYDRTILFFHAEWCPECRAFEAELKDTDLPDGLQILKVDYDTATELKQQHDVTIQTTFVDVDDDGEQLGSWVGYEKDRSLDTILDGLG